MDALFALLFLASLILFVIGIFNPKTSLFWDKKKRTRKKSILVYGGLMILFSIFGAATDKTTPSKTNDAEQVATSTPAVEMQPQLTQAQKNSIDKIEREQQLEQIKQSTISAPELTATYEANEVSADQNFKSKTFYVKGTVTDIKKDILGDIYVTLEGDQMLREVQCYFDDEQKASQLKKGMEVTFKGTCDGLMMNVIMKGCTLVGNS